jgi:hypothetical protein
MQVAAPILMDLGIRQVIRDPFGTLRALYRATQLGPRELAVDLAQVFGAGRQSLTHSAIHCKTQPADVSCPAPRAFLCAERESMIARKWLESERTRSRAALSLISYFLTESS